MMEPGQVSTAAVVALRISGLSDAELATLHLAVTFPGHDCTTLPFYDAIKDLFTDDGSMHQSTLDALSTVVAMRLIDA